MLPVSEQYVVLIHKTNLTPDMLELRFAKPAGFDYLAGQFLQFLIPHQDKEVPRAYSLASMPTAEHLEFCIKVIPGGVGSTYFSHLQINESAKIRGPRGQFCVKEGNTPLFFVATGAGLAPIIGIIEDELYNKKNTAPLYLLFGVRAEKDLFWQERLQRLAQEFSNFTFDTTLSQPQTPNHNKLTGRVTAHLREKIQKKNTDQQHFFLCGSLEMIKDARAILTEKGVDPKKVHFEIF